MVDPTMRDAFLGGLLAYLGFLSIFLVFRKHPSVVHQAFPLREVLIFLLAFSVLGVLGIKIGSQDWGSFFLGMAMAFGLSYAGSSIKNGRIDISNTIAGFILILGPLLFFISIT